MPKLRAIVFVESIDSGAFRPAVLNSEWIGPEVWRGKVFRRISDISALEDQDLADIAKALGIEQWSGRIDCTEQVWFRASKTQSIYLRTREETEEMAKNGGTAPKRKRAPKNAEKVGSPGRPSDLAGKKIYVKAAENPRRKGTIGHKSFALIKNGMAIEDFVAAGGRLVDLRWDMKAKNVEVK